MKLYYRKQMATQNKMSRKSGTKIAQMKAKIWIEKTEKRRDG